MYLRQKNNMGQEALKLELIEWLTKLEDKETMEYLKIVKDSKSTYVSCFFFKAWIEKSSFM